MPYTIKVLEDREFNKLPYKYAKESLGAADPKNSIAYVRNTHWGEISKTINLLTIQHELEELIAKTSPHEEDGIRYKKGRDIIAPIATIIGSVINPFLGAAMAGGYGTYKQTKGEQGLGQTLLSTALAYGGGQLAQGARGGQTFGEAFKAGTTASAAKGGGMIGQTLSGIQSGITGTSGAQTALSAQLGKGAFSLTGDVAPGLPTATAIRSGAIIPMAGSAYIPSPTTSLLATSALSNIGQSPGLTQIPGQTIRTPGISGGDILKGLTNPLTMMGVGSMGMSALSTSTTPPNLGDIVGKWLTADTVTRAGARAKEIADVKYAGDFIPSKEIQGFIEVMGKDIDKAYKQRHIDMDRMGLSVNEQFMTSGERLEMHRRLDEEGQREKDLMQSQWLLTAKQQYSQEQYNYIMEQLQADEATKRDLLYGELSDVIWKYNIQQEDLMNFRKIAADAGMYMIQAGTSMLA